MPCYTCDGEQSRNSVIKRANTLVNVLVYHRNFTTCRPKYRDKHFLLILRVCICTFCLDTGLRYRRRRNLERSNVSLQMYQCLHN